MKNNYLTPTQEARYKFISKGIKGNVVMLNLLRFRKIADYNDFSELKPDNEISGKEAYELYINHTLSFLERSGGELIFMGEASNYLIGPIDEVWDAVLLVKQRSVEDFLAFEQNKEYMAGIGHRIAALEDSRLLPIIENKKGS